MSLLCPLATGQQADRDRKPETSAKPSPDFKLVQLYGGAIVVELPETFEDVRYVYMFSCAHFKHIEIHAHLTICSQIRQIPDHQEVYLDREGFSSIVFDILGRVGRVVTKNPQNDRPDDDDDDDLEALKYHLHDLVESDAAQTILHNTQSHVELKKMPGTKALTLLATCPPGEKMRGRANEPDFVGILLLLLRLESQKTDVLVATNVPHMEGEYVKGEVDPDVPGKLGRLLEVGIKVRERICETLEVRDWGLFGEE